MKSTSLMPIGAIILVAFVLFVPLFATCGIGRLDFWWWMTGNLVVLTIASCAADRSLVQRIRSDMQSGVTKKLLLGVASALLLYAVFFVGNMLVRALFPFAGDNIRAVYQLKEGASPVRIVLLMTLVIGPAEEIFWRGYLQDAIARKTTPWKGLTLSVLAYAGVHVASGNIILVVAALVAGTFWGWLYLRYRSVLLNAVSHTAWDLLVFLILPLSS